MPSRAHVIGSFVHVMAVSDRILVHVGAGELRPVDPAEVFVLEAEGDETRVRLRSARPFRSERSLGDLEAVFAPPTASCASTAITWSTCGASALSGDATTAGIGSYAWIRRSTASSPSAATACKSSGQRSSAEPSLTALLRKLASPRSTTLFEAAPPLAVLQVLGSA